MNVIEYFYDWWSNEPKQDFKGVILDGDSVDFVMFYGHDDGKAGECDNVDLTIWDEDIDGTKKYKLSFDIYRNRIIIYTYDDYQNHHSDRIETDFFNSVSDEELFQYSTAYNIPSYLTDDEFKLLVLTAKSLVPEIGV